MYDYEKDSMFKEILEFIGKENKNGKNI